MPNASLISKIVSLPPSPIRVTRDVAYGKGGGRTLRMHIARPIRKRRDGRPGVVYIFGGSWRGGTPDQGILAVIALAFHGYVAATIDYRLSDEATFPAQLHDCKCAIRYLRAHAGALGLDRGRIAATGPSAGGHLAALLGTTSDIAALEGDGGWAEQRSDVQAVVDWFGPTDLPALPNVAHASSSPSRLLGGPVGEMTELAALANPANHITAAAPPFLIVHGADDDWVPIEQSELLHAALQEAGVPSELVVIPGKGHGYLGLGALKVSARFLDATLRTSPPRSPSP